MSERVIEVFEIVLLIALIMLILVVFVVCWITVDMWIRKWMGVVNLVAGLRGISVIPIRFI